MIKYLKILNNYLIKNLTFLSYQIIIEINKSTISKILIAYAENNVNVLLILAPSESKVFET